jgi:hypothetical protein
VGAAPYPLFGEIRVILGETGQRAVRGEAAWSYSRCRQKLFSLFLKVLTGLFLKVIKRLRSPNASARRDGRALPGEGP